jgi:hypothetical protein
LESGELNTNSILRALRRAEKLSVLLEGRGLIAEQTWELEALSVRNTFNGLLWIGGLLVYIVLSGAVRLAPPNAPPLIVTAAGTFGAEQVVGIVSDIGSPDGPRGEVVEETVAVRLSRSAVTSLLKSETIGAAWSALHGERLRAIGKAGTLTAGTAASPPPPPVAVQYDLFLSHAFEDKDAIARPLYAALTAKGVSVWFDEATLEIGDILGRKIDEGLSKCRYGVVILSPSFLSKQWTQHELDGLVARETTRGEKAILPVWYQLDQKTLLEYSPPLAQRLAGRSEEGIDVLVEKILRVLRKVG